MQNLRLQVDRLENVHKHLSTIDTNDNASINCILDTVLDIINNLDNIVIDAMHESRNDIYSLRIRRL